MPLPSMTLMPMTFDKTHRNDSFLHDQLVLHCGFNYDQYKVAHLRPFKVQEWWIINETAYNYQMLFIKPIISTVLKCHINFI